MKILTKNYTYLLWILIICLVALLLLFIYEMTLGKKKKEVLKNSLLLKKIEELNKSFPIEYAPISETREKNFQSASYYSSYTKAKAKKEFASYGKKGEEELAKNMEKYLEYEKQYLALKREYLACEETLEKVGISKKRLAQIEEEALKDLKQAKPESEYSIYVEVNLKLDKSSKSKSFTLTHEDY